MPRHRIPKKLPSHSAPLWLKSPVKLWRHFHTFRGLLREEVLRKWRVSWDRRFRHGRSGPPVSLSLDLTRRCNLKCRMCDQHRHAAAPPAGIGWYDPTRELPLSAWTNLLDQ